LAARLFGRWESTEFLDLHYVAKFDGDRSRELGERVPNTKKTSRVKHKPVRNGGSGRPNEMFVVKCQTSNTDRNIKAKCTTRNVKYKQEIKCLLRNVNRQIPTETLEQAPAEISVKSVEHEQGVTRNLFWVV